MEPEQVQGVVTPTAAAPVVPDAPAQPQVVATPAQPAQPAPAPQVLPETAPDRTKEQFEKLIESNKRLFQANELLRQEITKRTQSQQTFDPIQRPVAPAQPAQPVRQPDPKDFIEVDEYGNRYVNEEKLQNAFNQLRQEASTAKQTVEQYIQTAEQREIERQNRETYSSYPELNPQGASFDYGFAQQVRATLIDSMVNSTDYGGRALNFKEAADLVKGRYAPAVTPAPVIAQPVVTPEQVQAQQALKDQASLSPTGQNPVQARQNYADNSDIRDLQFKTRMGSDEALARRLIHTPHILPPDARVE